MVMKEGVKLRDKPNVDFSVEPLKGDASDRSYFRLTFSGDNAFPKSIVLMKMESPFKEDDFDFTKLQNFLTKCNVPVPRIYLTNPARGFIYLEDCGDALMAESVIGMKESELMAAYRRALDVLLTLQLEGTRRMDEKNPAGARRFDTPKFMEELDHTKRHFIKGLNGKSLSGADENRLEKIFTQLVGPIEGEPFVFTHRDYHSRNIMLKGDRIFILDFQDARMGPIHYDPASLLFDSYVKLTDETRNELVDYFIDRWNLNASRKLDKKNFYSMFRRVSLQRNLKALGTFGYQAVVKGNRFYTRFVPDTVEYIRVNVQKLDELKGDAEWLLSLIEKE
ncbi:MAG: aminoglycoside phosphotransferase [bacterium]|nr:MAG: aminoglycoside phosphotransferase [bacterium]